jgi:hypothetical protein
MGYVPQRRTFKLRFEDEDMQGLQVRARSVPLGTFLDLVKLLDVADTKSVNREDARKVDQLFKGFAKALVDWNLEEPEGVPVPATFEGLKSQDIDFSLHIVRAWIGALTQVPDFLANGSSGGGRSLELSMPMEARSSNPAS